MANFNTIISSIWEDDKFRKLNDSKSKLLFIYAFSNTRCPISGIYKVSIETMSFETGIKPNCKTNLQHLIEADLVLYDFDKNVIWVRGKIKHDKSWSSKQRMKSIERSISEFSKCSFMQQSFYQQYPFLIDLAIEVEKKEKELSGHKASEPEPESVSVLEAEKESE